MKINISLPRPIDYGYDTAGVKSFLKQLELSVHHAQKSLEEMVKMNTEREKGTDFNILYRINETIEDSHTGEKCKCNLDNPYTDSLELEIYD